MIISKDDRAYLNIFAAGQGEEALLYLAKKIHEYYTNELMTTEGNSVYRSQGAAQLADWLKKLPKGLRDGNATSIPANLG